MTDTQVKRPRGRPKGPDKKPSGLRLTDAHNRDLHILHEVMTGKPTIQGLFEEAVQSFVDRMLLDPVIRGRYNNELNKFEQKPKLVG